MKAYQIKSIAAIRAMWLILFAAIGLFGAAGCEEGIDPISRVKPGPDESAPVVSIKYPIEGTKIKVAEPVTSLNIEFEATDDIELGTVSVYLDDVKITEFTSFKDYRRFIGKYLYEELETGDHMLTVAAVDLEGKETSSSVTFSKEPPYVPRYDGEVFYMPFDADLMELVSITYAVKVGNPGFSDDGVVPGGKSYAGATDGYLTFPGTGLTGSGFSASFWMKMNPVPESAGILVMSPIDPANPDAMNNRNAGFRFFRENAAGKQRFKLNIGTGDAEKWFDGGAAADVDPTTGEWMHFAFAISFTEAAVYINGQPVSQGAHDGIDWTGVDLLSIMSGAPRFTGWNHFSDLGLMDELRIFNKALTQAEIQTVIAETGQDVNYEPIYDGEVFYMPFNGSNLELVGKTMPAVVGTPGFAGSGVAGDDSYAGAPGSYLTFPIDGFKGDALSAVFWLKINATPDRAGLLTVGPPDPDNPDAMNVRTSGFRFFRENANGKQRIKLNIGTGDSDVWFDGGAAAEVDPSTGDWVHLAFTISASKGIIYIDGQPVSEGDITGISWADCDILSIMSGAPRFTGWNHLSDESFMDELRLFNKTLTQQEIQDIIDAESL